jgi:hypothetical protein
VKGWIPIIGLIAASIVPLTAEPAGGQGPARLDLVAQTTFVGEDPAVVDIRVLGAPEGAFLRVTVHEAVTTRAGLSSSMDGSPPTDVIGQWVEEDLDAVRVGSGDVVSLLVPDEEIGELLRRPSDAGPHPMVIELVDGETVLDSLVTHLLVLPPAGDGPPPARLTVALLFDLGLPLTSRPDGTSAIDAQALDRAVDLASTMAARVIFPLTVELAPETFETLDESGPSEALDILRTASVGNSVLMSPWAEIDEEAWRRAGRADLVTAMYQRGRDVLETTAGIRTGTVTTLDPTATAATVSMLTAEPIGATGFVLDPTEILGVPDAVAAPVVVLDEEGSAHPAVVPDSFLEELATGPDPELAVQHTLAELLRMALAVDRDGAGDGAGVVMALDDMDLIALNLLLDGLDQPSPLVPGTVDEVLGMSPAELAPGTPIQARLSPVEPESLDEHVQSRAEVERRLDAYASMVDNAALVEPLRLFLLASVADSAAAERDDFLQVVSDRIESGFLGIELVDSGRITITSRRAELPLVIRNDQTLPIRVALALSAEKVDFPGGDRQIMVLQPGDNPVSLEVHALASGDSAINLRIESPEGGIELASGVVRLRSTAISGLGLLISVVALVVLLGWWVKTIHQRHRARRSAPDSVASPERSVDEPARVEP